MALLHRNRDGDERVLRKDRLGASPLKVGLAAVALLVLLTYFGFAKDIPFTHGFRVKVVFESANSIRVNSPVRIAGVNVGKVKSVAREPGSDAALVTMEIKKDGLPIHKDATMKIRPRIFLEGNFFVDVQPGTPSAPTIDDGDTIPVTQTSTPVQLDQVLTSLQGDTRANLRRLLEALGNGLLREPSAADDRDADPLARGETAAKSLNDSLRYGPEALRSSAIVADALRGSEDRDISKLVAGLDRVTEGLGRNEVQLTDLVDNFNTTLGATASESANLRASIGELGPTLQSANGALDKLNAAFPSTRAFAREILPGVRETPATITASFPWMAQTRPLLGPNELQGVARELSPATRDLAKVTAASLKLLPQADLVAKCFSKVILPTGDVKIQDEFSSGVENYKEFWYALVGLSGEGQNFDANGNYVRFQIGGSNSVVSIGTGTSDKQIYGSGAAAPLGTRPAMPATKPPYKPQATCYKNTPPQLNGAAKGPADTPPTSVPGATR
jgi:phospholipid/cholesterol/gamma-HCH transport system substrate-binding protein